MAEALSVAFRIDIGLLYEARRTQSTLSLTYSTIHLGSVVLATCGGLRYVVHAQLVFTEPREFSTVTVVMSREHGN